MRRSTTFAVRSASVAALLVLSLVVPASAGDECVTPSGTLVSSPLSLDGSLRAFTGNVAPFGQITGNLQLQINHNTGFFTGQFSFAAKGGTVHGTILGRFTSANTYVEALFLTGGTGAYTGISGYAYPVYGMLDPTNGTGVDLINGGQICLP